SHRINSPVCQRPWPWRIPTLDDSKVRWRSVERCGCGRRAARRGSAIVGAEQRVAAAVDVEKGAAAECRVGSEQEGDRGRDRLRAPEAAERNRKTADGVPQPRMIGPGL